LERRKQTQSISVAYGENKYRGKS